LLQNTYGEKSQWFFFKMFYKAILGDGGDYDGLNESTPEFEEFFFVIYFVLTVFFIVIMLNLLIAIISETFGKVTSVESKAFQYERLNIIIEYEEMMSEEEKKTMAKKLEGNYLYVVHANENTGEEAELLKEMKTVKREQFTKMYHDISNNTQMIKTLNEENKTLSETSQKNHETLSKDLKELPEKLSKEITDKVTRDITEKMDKEIKEKLDIISVDLKNFIQSQQNPKIGSQQSIKK
jgi:lipopolysaccharide export LptBFGC system permease protein LptF